MKYILLGTNADINFINTPELDKRIIKIYYREAIIDYIKKNKENIAAIVVEEELNGEIELFDLIKMLTMEIRKEKMHIILKENNKYYINKLKYMNIDNVYIKYYVNYIKLFNEILNEDNLLKEQNEYEINKFKEMYIDCKKETNVYEKIKLYIKNKFNKYIQNRNIKKFNFKKQRQICEYCKYKKLCINIKQKIKNIM